MFMTKHHSQEDTKPAPASDQDSVMSLIWSMADVTWRMFTPPALLVPGGIWADLHWGTKPWLTILAAVLGLGLSIALVKRQLGDIPK